MKPNSKKRIAGAVAVLCAISLLLAGTFAWKDFTQQGATPFAGGKKYDVTLDNAFKQPEAWTTHTPPIPNKYTVINLDTSEAPVLVRIRFKEYLKAFKLNYSQYIMDGSEPVLFATSPADIGYSKGEYLEYNRYDFRKNYTPYNVRVPNLNEPDRPLYQTYCRTNNTYLADGVYGSPMLDPMVVQERIEMPNMLFGGVENIRPASAHTVHGVAEINFKTHLWDGTPITNYAPWDGTSGNPQETAIEDYIQWQMGHRVTTLEKWQAAGCKIENVWILAEDGWCYWANALLPNQTTPNILENIRLLQYPGDTFDYVIHAEMQAISFDMLGTEWENASASIKKLMQDVVEADRERSVLTLYLAEVKALREADYTFESWEALQKQIQETEHLLEFKDFNAPALRLFKADLQQKREALVPA